MTLNIWKVFSAEQPDGIVEVSGILWTDNGPNHLACANQLEWLETNIFFNLSSTQHFMPRVSDSIHTIELFQHVSEIMHCKSSAHTSVYWCTGADNWGQGNMAKLSPYAEKLSQEAKDKYLDKISTISGVDPFSEVAIGDIYSTVPSVDACDLVSYLVLKTSFMTITQWKISAITSQLEKWQC